MRKAPHIAIIGAGLIGLSTADSLSRRGAQVTVIDKKAGPGLGASFSNSGMIHPSQAAPWLEGDFQEAAIAVLDLARRSAALLEDRRRSLGFSAGDRARGCVQIYESADLRLQAAERYAGLGVVCEPIKSRDDYFGRYGLLFPGDSSGNAYAYCAALETGLKARGVDFTYGQQGVSLTDFSTADHIVIAAGTGSRAMAASAGVDLPVTPLRGHALHFERPDMPLPLRPVMHHASRSALTVFEDHVRLSGTAGEDVPDALMGVWKKIAPELVAALKAPIFSWSEDRPMSQLGRPIITRLAPGLWINTGHAHMGWTLSAGSGELMSQMILDGREDTRFGLESFKAPD